MPTYSSKRPTRPEQSPKPNAVNAADFNFENNQSKSSGRGGARRNAGRKRGSATTKTRAIADKAAAEGLTPLEIMLAAMRELHAKGDLINAARVAKDAAPFVHPRLSSVEVEHSGSNIGPITHAAVSVEEYEAALARQLARYAVKDEPS